MTDHHDNPSSSDGEDLTPEWPCPSCSRPITYPTGGNRAWCDDCGNPMTVNGDTPPEEEEELDPS